MTSMFISGDEAVAQGVALARPDVISAYPITPQTVVVEELSSMVAAGTLDATYLHVESEHSALSAALGASASGVRAFTATSSQGLLYMAELLTYVSGGGFPVVMMNANRSTALPWNIYGDQRDSISLLDHGWIQAYARDAQEALDLTLMAFRIAEDPRVRTPFMVCLDGFSLTHTYETVDVPTQQQADAFLPLYETDNCFDFEHPVSIGFSAGPDTNDIFKLREHEHMLATLDVLADVEADFERVFGRHYTGPLEGYRCDDADYVLVTLGTTAGLAHDVVDELRSEGLAAGCLRIRYLRPFPSQQLACALASAKAACVVEQDISFGYEGTVFTDVNSALFSAGVHVDTYDFIGGLGGRDMTPGDIRHVFDIAREGGPTVNWLGLGVQR